jgi:hypothetical protein
MDRYQDLLGISNVYFPKKSFKIQRHDTKSRRKMDPVIPHKDAESALDSERNNSKEGNFEDRQNNLLEQTKNKRLKEFYNHEMKEILESARKSEYI